MVLKTDGTLWATGANDYGQRGYGTTANISTSVQIMTDVASVVAIGRSTMILKTDKTLWATGLNDYGQLGTGSTSNISIPVQVFSNVQSVYGGGLENALGRGIYTMIIKTDGTFKYDIS